MIYFGDMMLTESEGQTMEKMKEEINWILDRYGTDVFRLMYIILHLTVLLRKDVYAKKYQPNFGTYPDGPIADLKEYTEDHYLLRKDFASAFVRSLFSKKECQGEEGLHTIKRHNN